MDSWIIWIVGISIAYWIGHAVGGHMKAYQMMQNMINNPDVVIELVKKLKAINDTEELANETIPDDAIIIKTEEVNGQVYAYDKLSGEFLAQAQTLHQAIVLASKRFPGKKFWHPSLQEDSQTA